MKPRIDRTNVHQWVVKVGHTALIDIDIIGEPAPTVTWIFNNKVRYIYILVYNTCVHAQWS